jgi:hypothetical protein
MGRQHRIWKPLMCRASGPQEDCVLAGVEGECPEAGLPLYNDAPAPEHSSTGDFMLAAARAARCATSSRHEALKA